MCSELASFTRHCKNNGPFLNTCPGTTFILLFLFISELWLLNLNIIASFWMNHTQCKVFFFKCTVNQCFWFFFPARIYTICLLKNKINTQKSQYGMNSKAQQKQPMYITFQFLYQLFVILTSAHNEISLLTLEH